jgi:hypothetical protein
MQVATGPPERAPKGKERHLPVAHQHTRGIAVPSLVARAGSLHRPVLRSICRYGLRGWDPKLSAALQFAAGRAGLDRTGSLN